MMSSPVFSDARAHRQRVEVVDRRAFLLPAVRIQGLLEIALLVGKPDAVQCKITIARRLHVVAREQSQAAGVDLHAIEQSVLHRKISDAGRVLCLRSHVQVRDRAAHRRAGRAK